AIGAIRMMPGREIGAVAGKALAAIERDPVLLRGRLMRVVAARARHGVSRFLLALALRESFHLADGAQARPLGVYEKKIPGVVGELVSRSKLVHMSSRAFDGSIGFQMALHADVIASRGSQLGGVDDGAAIDGSISRPMAASPCHSVVRERRLGIAVVGAGRGRLHPSCVTVQAARVSGKVQRD